MMKKVLVTGGGGFIGSHLAKLLLERGFQVRVMDNFLTGRRENLREVEGRLEGLMVADIRDPEACRKAARGMEAVFHQAALPSVPRSVEDPALTSDINIGGTLNLLLAARDQGVKRFIFASSSSVYGDSPVLPKKEDQLPIPLSPYGVQKLTGEHYVRLFSSLYGMETVSLRYFNVFGPGQDPQSQYAAVFPRFMTAVLRGEPLEVYGDGEQSRDFTFVGDVAEANLDALRAPLLRGECVNLACGRRYSLNQLIGILGGLRGGKPRVHYLSLRPGDIKHSQADIRMAEEILGYRAKTTFEEGVRKTFEAFRDGERARHE